MGSRSGTRRYLIPFIAEASLTYNKQATEAILFVPGHIQAPDGIKVAIHSKPYPAITSETRSDRFEVKHCITGKLWTNIAAIKTKGESSDLVSYQFTHSTPSNGENLYRLKMVDLDGTFCYSKIERVKIDAAFTVTVYPNPAAETISLTIADWSKVTGVQMLNSTGKVVYKSDRKSVEKIDVKTFSPGLYFLKVGITDRRETVHKLVIAHY